MESPSNEAGVSMQVGWSDQPYSALFVLGRFKPNGCYDSMSISGETSLFAFLR